MKVCKVPDLIKKYCSTFTTLLNLSTVEVFCAQRSFLVSKHRFFRSRTTMCLSLRPNKHAQLNINHLQF